MDEHFAYFLANGECRMKVAGEGFCGGGGEKDRWNEKYKSVSVLMRVARDGSHAFRRDAEGKKGKKKKEGKTLVGRKGGGEAWKSVGTRRFFFDATTIEKEGVIFLARNCYRPCIRRRVLVRVSTDRNLVPRPASPGKRSLSGFFLTSGGLPPSRPLSRQLNDKSNTFYA